MTIDNTDISKYGARQQNVEMSYGEIKNRSEWPEGNLLPIMLPGTVGFKVIKVGIVLKSNSNTYTRDYIWKMGSQLVASLIKPAVVTLEGFDHSFCVYLKNAAQVEHSLQRWHKATLELVGYEMSGQYTTRTWEGVSNWVEKNDGSLITPAILKITPLQDMSYLTIRGLVRDPITGKDEYIVVKNLKEGRIITIDGETGLVTENGENKFADVEMYDFPSLLPGDNRIVVQEPGAKVTLLYRARYI